ncbi:MAG TPA: YHS domain-containing (seleno)protein [Casimicrobiaceae bacterium]|nr:YHS domain-containing (seleno)protein [Casimicrobiaceae bacterium]
MPIVLLRPAIVIAFAMLVTGCGTVHNTIADRGDDRVMLRGNDAVAYVTQGKPVPGQPSIKSVYDGDVYRFTSETNKQMFDANPQRYAPAYAGFCASGAPYALKAAIGANVFAVHRDRLYLFGSERSKANFMMDADENIKVGDAYWANETKDVPFRIQNFKRYVLKVPGYKTDAELDQIHLKRFGKLPPGAPAQKS